MGDKIQKSEVNTETFYCHRLHFLQLYVAGPGS